MIGSWKTSKHEKQRNHGKYKKKIRKGLKIMENKAIDPKTTTMSELRELTPREYFEYVKSKKQTITEEELLKVYDAALELMKKYMITKQKKAINKLQFFLEAVEQELPIIKAGYNQFIYRWDMEEYIEKISDNSVFIMEVSKYEREYPDEVVDEILKAQKVFGEDNLYVVFTDYTKKEQRKIAKERREKDPIIFGALKKDGKVLDRLYYICDWVDEYCDLTLDKLVNEYASKKDGKSIVHKVPNVVNDVKELKKQLGLLKESKDEKKDEYTYNDSFGNLGVISNTIYIHEDDSNE